MRVNKVLGLLLTVILVFLMIVPGFSAFAVENVFEISSAEDLKKLSELDTDFGNMKVLLLNDITVNDGDFSLDENKNPLYNGSFERPESFSPVKTFNGVFDGQGYTISGLFLNSSLFENCKDAVIKNLNVVNSLVADKTSESMAVICSVAEDTTFENCYLNSYAIGNGKYTGGLVGEALNCIVSACRNEGAIIGANAGGLFGYIKNSTIKFCYNKASIWGDKSAGGLAINLNCCKVSDCYNSGDVNANKKDGVAGGFACYVTALSKETYGSTIKYCYTAGDVIGYDAGKFCSNYGGDIFAMVRVYYEGEDINDLSDADSNAGYKIIDQYEDYKKYRELSHSGIYAQDDCIERLHLIKVDSLKHDWCPEYIGFDDYVGDAAGLNRGYPQLTMFHEHVWGDYKYDSAGTETAKCLCYNCDGINTRPHEHIFGEYIVNEDKQTETGVCECGEMYTRPHTHAFGDYIYNNDADCEKNGTMTAVCTGKNCGVTDTVNDPNHKATGHSFGEWKYNHNAKLFANGTETRLCHCGYSETRDKARSAKIIVIYDAIVGFISGLFK